MAYEKYTWVDGELITAEKLNHIEDGIAEGGDCGFACTEEITTLFNGTITTVQDGDYAIAELPITPYITADEITVTVDGTEYVCPKIEINVDEEVCYGGYDTDSDEYVFTDFPFVFSSQQVSLPPPRIINAFITPTAGTYTLEIKTQTTTVETTECFERAVKSACGRVLVVNAREISSTGILRLDKTWAEIQEAVVSHGVVVRTSLLGGNEIYAPVTVMVMAGLYRVLMLDGTAVTFTTSSVNGYPEYRKGSQT